MNTVYTENQPERRRILVEITDHEIADLLDDLKDSEDLVDAFTATRRFIELLSTAHSRFTAGAAFECETRVLTRDNADAIAAWVGGQRAGGARELVAIYQSGNTFYASPGDAVHRDSRGTFTIHKPVTKGTPK